jgi:hypothetical protein
MKTEQETVETCVANLRALEAIKDVDLRERDNRLPLGVDAKLVLRTNAGQLVYFVEVKRTVSAQGLEHLLLQLDHYARETKAKPLLLSNYISPGLAERLIHAGVNFADAAGNVYLNWPGKLHIQIQGARQKQLVEAKSERLAQPSGLKVLYALLTQASEDWGGVSRYSEGFRCRARLHRLDSSGVEGQKILGATRSRPVEIDSKA